MTLYTWNPNDTSGGTGGMSFSPGNLTCSNANGWATFRGTGSFSTGKLYAEITAVARGPGGGGGFCLGPCNASQFQFMGTNAANALGWYADGSLNFVGTSMPTIANGDVLSIAFDFAAKKFWGRKNGGAWAPSGDPGAGTGGADFSAVTGPYFPGVAFDTNGSATGNFGPDAFKYPVPSGFAGFSTFPAGSNLACTIWAGLVPATGAPVLAWAGGGNPATGIGGYSFAAGPLPGAALYLTAFGTGDASLSLNTAPLPGRVPKGFYPGWPSSFGLISDQFDPATKQGSAVVGSTTVSFPSSPGLVQGQTGLTRGRYYYEYMVTGTDSFSGKQGIGVGRKGLDMNVWSNAGGYNAGDVNGGAQIDGGNIVNNFLATVNANEVSGPPIGNVTAGSIVGVAVLLTPDYQPFVFRPAALIPTPLVCIPCVEMVLPGQNFRNRFGA